MKTMNESAIRNVWSANPAIRSEFKKFEEYKAFCENTPQDEAISPDERFRAACRGVWISNTSVREKHSGNFESFVSAELRR